MCEGRFDFARLRAIVAAGVIVWAAALPAYASVLIAEPAGPDQETYNDGRSLIFEEQWSKARAVFDTLLRRYPNSSFVDDALYWTAFSLYQEEKPADAYQTLRSLITRYSESPWNDDARALMVRCAEGALKQEAGLTADRSARGESASEYRRFIEESTWDRSAQVKLVAIDTLLSQEPQKAADLLDRFGRGSAGQEGAVVVLDRFFGKDRVKVTFDEATAGFAEGNVHVLVREGDQAVRLTLSESLEAVRGRGTRPFTDAVRAEMSERILDAERSLVTQGEVKAEKERRTARGRTATIVRVVDGETHYYNNGAETIRIIVLRRTAGFTPENVQVYVEGSGGIRQIPLTDLTSAFPETTVHGISADALHYLTQSLGVIQLDLNRAAR